MTNSINVLNKKNEMEAVAVEMQDGRFEITEAGSTKTVAASTFKRWYKVIEVQETPEVEDQISLDELLEGSEVVEAVSVKLTNLEKMLLNGMRDNEYNDCLEAPVYSFTAIDNSGLTEGQAGGVISSLVKKGLVVAFKDDGYEQLSITPAGAELFKSADGEDCQWDGPKLFAVTAQETTSNEVVEISHRGVAEFLDVTPVEKKGKTQKIITKISYGVYDFVIVEYDGYVCGVDVLDEGTEDLVYRSKKMSIKDALENVGYTGDNLKLAKKEITRARKAAKSTI